MVFVGGVLLFWFKEIVSIVWDSFFMGRYFDGFNEVFLLIVYLLKIFNYY